MPSRYLPGLTSGTRPMLPFASAPVSCRRSFISFLAAFCAACGFAFFFALAFTCALPCLLVLVLVRCRVFAAMVLPSLRGLPRYTAEHADGKCQRLRRLRAPAARGGGARAGATILIAARRCGARLPLP